MQQTRLLGQGFRSISVDQQNLKIINLLVENEVAQTVETSLSCNENFLKNFSYAISLKEMCRRGRDGWSIAFNCFLSTNSFWKWLFMRWKWGGTNCENFFLLQSTVPRPFLLRFPTQASIQQGTRLLGQDSQSFSVDQQSLKIVILWIENDAGQTVKISFSCYPQFPDHFFVLFHFGKHTARSRFLVHDSQWISVDQKLPKIVILWVQNDACEAGNGLWISFMAVVTENFHDIHELVPWYDFNSTIPEMWLPRLI